jgi:DNA-binding CsgD family transcriptional regulator
MTQLDDDVGPLPRGRGGAPKRGPLLAAARTLEHLPMTAAVLRVADRRVVWANAFMRQVEGIDEWPDVDLTGTAAPGELDAIGDRLRDYSRSGESFTVVRSFRVAGEYVQVLMSYWDPCGVEPREYVAFTARQVERAASQPLTEWIDDWPQPAAVVHLEHGVQHANVALQDLVGAAQCADDLIATLVGAVGSDAARGLSMLARGDGSDTLRCGLACADGTVRHFVVARMPPLSGVDPDIAILVGHPLVDEPPFELPASLSRREREITALLLDGHRVATIAQRLSLSPHTVRNHLRSIFIKLNVTSQSELIVALRPRSGS